MKLPDANDHPPFQQRDEILAAVNFTASLFLQSSNWRDALDAALARLGESTQANRAYVFENELREADGTVLTSQLAEWVAPGIDPQIDNPDLQNFSFSDSGLDRWLDLMNRCEPVFGLISTFPEHEREILESQDIQSLVVMPVFSQNHLWGFLGFDDCESLRAWSQAELIALSAAATALGAAIDRHHLEKQLRFAQKMDAIGSLAAGVAHDFNNMLQAISAFTSIAKAKIPDASPGQTELDQVLVATDRAHDLTRQLLSFARKQELRPKKLDVGDLLESVIGMLRPLLGSSIQLSDDIQRPSPMILADEGLISQVLMNLCLNARDAMPSGGRLKLKTEICQVSPADSGDPSTEHAGDYAVLSVSDNGCGMSADVMQRIFEPFYTTKPGRGTGLGLSVAFGTIQQSGGFIKVHSETGKGSQFRVFIPLVNGEISSDTSQTGTDRGTDTILLVDDEPLVLVSLSWLVESFGYTVLTAESVDQAIDIYNAPENQIDLVLTDQVMPKRNGISLVKAIRQQDPNARAILMSGYASDYYESEGELLDIPLVRKPVNHERLCKIIRETLSRNSAQ